MVRMAEVVSIHRVAERNGPAEWLQEAPVRTGYGIEGDWRSNARTSRQLTLIEQEALDQAARLLDRPLPFGVSRRQVVVRGLPLNPTVGSRLRLGQLVLEVTEVCDPCDNMERTIGRGGKSALTNRGGICARVLAGGTLRVGDAVTVLEEVASPVGAG
jgi:MOSC domain-containing protein YiiM